MAVEARHLNFIHPQLIGNRGLMDAAEGNANAYGNRVVYGVAPLSRTTTTTETLIPMYGTPPVTDSVVEAKVAMKADSGLTHALSFPRKREREAISPLFGFSNGQSQKYGDQFSSFSFLGEDISLQIQQQQMEIDCIIAQHTERVRSEIEERRKRFSRRVVAAVEEGMIKKLKAKEEEIEKIGKLNWALEERLKSLYIENQIWRDLAQTNEATATVLRSNLEQVLAQFQDDQRNVSGGVVDEATAMDDTESYCDSNFVGGDLDEQRRTLAKAGGERKLAIDENNDDGGTINGYCNNRWCKNCGKEESCVLLLPCRHLCLCTVCGSLLNTCPVCKSTKNATLHVNILS